VRYFEEYQSCGCVSKQYSKRNLPGYCGAHGNNPAHVYDTNGKCIWDWRNCDLIDHPSNRAAVVTEDKTQ